MEALAAISLAGNILQFLDFAGSVVSKTGQIYDPASGTLEEHDDQENTTSHLKTLTGNIKAADGPSALQRGGRGVAQGSARDGSQRETLQISKSEKGIESFVGQGEAPAS